MDGTTRDGKVLRACFTKYCNAFPQYQQCSNPDCLYLHDMGSDNDSFTKEEMLARYGSKHAQSFHDATKIGANNGVKTKILPAPANGSTQGRLGVTANGLSRAEDTHPRGHAAPSNIAANDGGSSWAGKTGPGSSRRARSRGSASGAARVRVVRRRGARAVVVPHPEQRRRPHLQRERRVPLLWHRRRERLGRVQRPAREHG